MENDPLSNRVSDVRKQLVQEFAPELSSETVIRCLEESLSEYQDARVPDFVPLFVHRQTRARLVRLLLEARQPVA